MRVAVDQAGQDGASFQVNRPGPGGSGQVAIVQRGNASVLNHDRRCPARRLARNRNHAPCVNPDLVASGFCRCLGIDSNAESARTGSQQGEGKSGGFMNWSPLDFADCSEA